MKLKELYKKYDPQYHIIVFGRPLSQPTTPFSYLPYDRKELMNMEVAEMKIEEKKYVESGISFRTMKPTKPVKRKGHIYVYVKKVEESES